MPEIDYGGCESAAQQELLREVVEKSLGNIFYRVWGNMVASKPYIIAFHRNGTIATFGIDTTKREATQ